MMITHDSTYDDDYSIHSNLDYINQEGNIDIRVDSYDFVHDTETYTPLDIPPEHDDKYFDYLDKHYSLFDDDGLIYMQKLTDNNIANHIKEFNNDVTRVNLDVNYSYQRKQMVVNQFNKIFQGIIDADPSLYVPIVTLFSRGLVHR